LTNPGLKEAFAVFLRKIQEPLQHFRPEPIGNAAMGGGLEKISVIGVESDGCTPFMLSGTESC
jgi:hypothetical protein